jgi:hypothetical protein
VEDVMKLLRIGGAAGLAFVLAACGGDTTDDTVVTDRPMTADTVMTAGQPATQMEQAHVNLSPVGDSQVRGQAHMTQTGPNETEVHASLTGATQTGEHHGHIHSGTCDQLGAIVAQLEPITTQAQGTGESHSRVQFSLAQIRDGGHVIAFHQAGGTRESPGPHVTCGEIR